MDIKTCKGRDWLLPFFITLLFLAPHNLGLIISSSYAAGEKDEWAKVVIRQAELCAARDEEKRQAAASAGLA